MVKQFTIPCQFGQETSPVTLYIGHPEGSHHPVHFQSEWLSSAKGGTIPQDLMDTLQKLHDLAEENGADFEELCYYALISATQHSTNGVSQDDINKYADEFVKKEGNVETSNQDNNEEQQSEEEKQFGAATTKSKEEQHKDVENLNKLGEINSSEPKEAEKVENSSNTNTSMQNKKKEPSLKIESEKNSSANGNNANSTATNLPASGEVVNAYTEEDEDLLLADDLLEEE